MGYVPDHERIQLEMYMWLFETPRAVHVENYDSQSGVTWYSPDNDLWSKILGEMEHFVRAFDQFCMRPDRHARASEIISSQQSRAVFGSNRDALTPMMRPAWAKTLRAVAPIAGPGYAVADEPQRCR